ncbi:MAG: ABC transporter ATP-binding protein [Bacteriovorax sp.]|jgi:NitT/TauT family transport system ATP-binding protein
MNKTISIQNLNFSYGQKNMIFTDLNLEINNGEFVCIIGPSGCGKSTLLHLLAGFIKNKSGNICTTHRKSVVFQKHNLFPWKTVLQNIMLGLTTKGSSQTMAKTRARTYLDFVGLSEHEDKYPYQLSIGMQQRVGIARAFAEDPELLLMDEPFGSLDAQTRYKMQQLLFDIWQKESKTIIFITHDIDEAILLADRIIVLSNSPARVKAEIQLTLPHPRNSQCLVTREAIEIRKNIFDLLL